MQLRLKQLRESRNLSQQVVADSIGCTTAAYSRYENGQRQPSIDTLIGLAEFYGVSVDYVVGRSEPSESTLSEYELALVTASRNADMNVREIVLDVLESKPKSKK